MTDNRVRLREEFELFRGECISLRNCFNTYLALYHSDKEVEAALRSSAELFFSDLNEWLIEILVLRVGRLTDPARSSGNRNLTVCYLIEELGDAGLLTSEIDDLAAKLQRYRERIRPARNKFVSHMDLKAYRAGEALGGHEEREVYLFFSNLQCFTDRVGVALGVGPLDYSSQAGSGDVTDLIRVLKRPATR